MNAGAYYYDRKKRELDIVKCFPFVVSELLRRWFMVLISMSGRLKLKIYLADQEVQHFYGTSPKFVGRKTINVMTILYREVYFIDAFQDYIGRFYLSHQNHKDP